MLISEIFSILNKICPEDLAEEWDNSGQQIFVSDNEVSGVLVSLEITSEVIEETIEKNCNLIVTHHPLFFSDFKAISYEKLENEYSIRLIKNDISVYSCHTNFDKIPGGNNDYLGNLLGIKNTKILSGTQDIARIGKIDERYTIKEFMERISSILKMDRDKIRFTGDIDADLDIISWCTGSGSEFMDAALMAGASLYITGDLKYHDARWAQEKGLNVMDIGHFGSEKIFTPNMAELLRIEIDKEIKSSKSKKRKKVEIIQSKKDIDPFTK